MQRYLLYRDRLLGPVEDLDVESLQDQLENAAIQGTSYWECDPWEEETKEKVQEHLPLCRRLYEFNIT